MAVQFLGAALIPTATAGIVRATLAKWFPMLYTWVVLYGLATFVKFVFAALGVAVVSYTGLDLIFQTLETTILDNLSGLPSTALDVLKILGVFDFIRLLLSGSGAIIAFQLSAGVLTKVFFKG